MNSWIESLNVSGGRFVDVAFPIFWQSSVLIAVVFGIDWLLRRKLRPAVRYALWLVVIAKLVLPPSLAFPTGVAWWLRAHKSSQPEVQTRILTVTSTAPVPVTLPSPTISPAPPSAPKLSVAAWAMVSSFFVSVLLAAWAGLRWRKISRCVRKTTAPPATISDLFDETRRKLSVRKNVSIRLTEETMSPAVCGLWRPVVLLPQSLIEKLSPEQLRAILLHELVHVRRRDVWINCAQTLLQIVYWWHPLVWFANARIRRVREDAVDDAVMVALNEESEIYAPTLLEVAKLAFNRPLAGLGIVGILESRDALRHRIERLLNFKTPGRAGFSAVWILALAAFSAVAVPMGEHSEKGLSASEQLSTPTLTEDTAPQHAEALVTNQHPPPDIIRTNPSRQKIFQKLNRITFDHISFTNMPLEEVVRTLNEQIQQRDSDHTGDLILIDKNGATPGASKMDPGRMNIDLRPGLKNVRLLDVLEAITKTSDHPIQYSLQDNGVVFAFRGPPSAELLTRTFKIDSHAFHQRLEQLGLHSTNVQESALNFFADAGISLGAPKSVFLNDRLGTITLRGTLDDLNAAEQVLEALDRQSGTGTNDTANRMQEAKLFFERGKLDEAWAILQKILSVDPDNQFALYYSSLIKQAQVRKTIDAANARVEQRGAHQLPNQILPATNVSIIRPGGAVDEELRVRTFKLDATTVSLNFSPIKPHFDIQPALSNLFQKAGVDLSAPKSLFFNDRAGTLTVRATESDLDMLEQIINTFNITPPEVTIKARFVQVDADNRGMDAFMKKFLTDNNGGAGTSAWTGILSHSQFALVLQALEKRKGMELLNEGEVTTLSGRQAEFEVVDVETLMTGVNATVTNNQTTYSYKMDTQPFGSTLNVVPTVSRDTNAVTMMVTPRFSEFLGYENPKDVAKYDEKLKGTKLPLPKSRVRQVTTAATIRDGQTLVIGNLSDEWVLKRSNGTELRQPYTDKKKKQLLIFITATIIDRAGHPIHPSDYYDHPSL